MGKAVPVYEQRNWKWFEDDAAEPVQQLAAENVKPTLPDNTSIIRLRIDITETAGESGNVASSLEYSLNDADWVAFDAGNHWNYGDGQATEGNVTTTYKLTGTDAHGEYQESDSNNQTFGSSNSTETDWAIQPTANVSAETTYYFRMLISDVEVPLGGGEAHPQVLTAEAPEPSADEASQFIVMGII